MFKNLLLILFVLLSVRGYTQSSTDSLYTYEQTKNNVTVAQLNTNFLLNTDIDRIGISLFNYQRENGGYRRAQQAQNTVIGGLRTEGINKFKRFITSGYFEFSRTWQDSLAWTTKGTEVDEQPYYYGSIKAGKYERFKYQLGGLASYSLIDKKLYVGVGLDYLYNSATRSVDPRPEVNTFELLLKPEILYKWKQHTIGVNALWGYGREAASITYKYNMFNTGANGYPDRKNYLIQGYGFVTNNEGNDPLRRFDRHYGIGLSYSTSVNSYSIKTSLNYKTILEDNFKVFKNSIRRSYISFYDTEKLSFFLGIDKVSAKFEHQLLLKYDQQQAEDLNIIFYAINYKYADNLFNLSYLFKHNQSPSFQKEFGLKLNYSRIQRDDLATDHHANYSSVEPALVANLYFKLKNKDRFSTGIDVGQRLPQKQFLSIPANQVHVFTTGVVYPDYYYYNSKVLRTSLKASYVTANVFSKFNAGLNLGVDYYKASLPSETMTSVPHGKPDDSFLRYNLSLNLYF